MKKQVIRQLIEQYIKVHVNTDQDPQKEEKLAIIHKFHDGLAAIPLGNDIPFNNLAEFYNDISEYINANGNEETPFIANIGNPINTLALEIIRSVVYELFQEDSEYSYSKLFPQLDAACVETVGMDPIETIESKNLFFSDYDKVMEKHYIFSIPDLYEFWSNAHALFNNYLSGNIFNDAEIKRLMEHPLPSQLLQKYQKQLELQSKTLIRGNSKILPSKATMEQMRLTYSKLEKAEDQPKANAVKEEFKAYLGSPKFRREEMHGMNERILIKRIKQDNSLTVLNLGQTVNKFKEGDAFGKECYHQIGGNLKMFHQDLTTGKKSLESLEILKEIAKVTPSPEKMEESTEKKETRATFQKRSQGQFKGRNVRNQRSAHVNLSLFADTNTVAEVQVQNTMQTLVEPDSKPIEADLQAFNVEDILQELVSENSEMADFLKELEQEAGPTVF